MRTSFIYFFIVATAAAQPYQINPVNMTRTHTRDAWITVNSNTTYFQANLGGGVAQTNISYTAVTNAPWQWGSANLTNWSGVTLFDTNGVTTAFNAADTVVSNGLSARIISTNAALTTRITDATNGLYAVVQPLDSDLTAIAALATTSFGRGLLTSADGAAARSTIGAGTSSFDGVFASLTSKPTTISGYGITDFNSLGDARWQIGAANLTNWAALATSAKQDADSDLTTIAGLTATTDNFMVAAASAWASRTPAQAKTALALVKADVGLGSVDNTSDASKPVSTAQESRVVAATNGLATAFTQYKTIANAGGSHIAARVAGTYFLPFGDAIGITGTGTLYPPVLIHIVGADYPTINGVAPKLRIRVVLEVNDVAPTGNFTFGLYPVTRPATSGAAGLDIYTMGTVVTGSNGATFTAPVADSQGTAVSSDFALPADGVYVIGVVTTATVAASSHLHMSATLQYHNN